MVTVVTSLCSRSVGCWFGTFLGDVTSETTVVTLWTSSLTVLSEVVCFTTSVTRERSVCTAVLGDVAESTTVVTLLVGELLGDWLRTFGLNVTNFLTVVTLLLSGLLW